MNRIKQVHQTQQLQQKQQLSNKKSKDVDSSDVSSANDDDDDDYENMTSDQISQRGKDKFFKTELMEKIVKYIKIDDSIKEHQKEIREQIKNLKTQKEEMEKYILSYLENIKEEYVNIGETARLTRKTSVTKGAIKMDNITISVVEGLKKQGILLEDKKILAVLESVTDNIDKNRPTKTRTYIKRTKGKVDKGNKKNNNNDSDDEEMPKYK